ncbi:MAG: FAD-binding protein [Methylacidiphilales bacterium]|nr:FAD-binding protein [Candidatus Methylacidiphilales bacterium]
MVDLTTILAGLGTILPQERILTALEDLIPYSFDGTAAMSHRPMVVAFAQTTEEVSRVVKWANESRTPLVVRGSGTGLAGGSIPTEGSVALVLSRFDRVLELDRRNLTLLTEPGVTTQTIFDEADRVGLLYPPDPGSMKISTIGGNVAGNSGGLRGLKYGVTKDYVMGFELVLPTGEVVWVGNKCVKDVAGYSLREVFIGSGGTLGIFTKILLRLLPRPAAKRTLLAVYAKMEQAAETVSAIIAHPIIPCTLEFLDRTTINCVEDYAKVGLPREAEAVLLMETDGHPAVVAEEAEIMARLAREQGALEVRVAATVEEAQRLATARRSAFAALARVAPTTILEDVTVPRSELAGMVAFVADLAKRHRLRIGTFGHMGDGNLHPTFLTNEEDEAEMHRVEMAFAEIVTETVRRGGTITGEHGVGLAKKKFLPQSVGDLNVQLMRKLKRLLDPNLILNPGKIFDCPADSSNASP